VAEKLTLQQIQGNGSAIQPDEGSPASRAEIMNGVRDQLLASASFSLDKDRGTRRRNPFDLFEYRFQSRTIPYHLLESALI
jgi:hypothetical protein